MFWRIVYCVLSGCCKHHHSTMTWQTSHLEEEKKFSRGSLHVNKNAHGIKCRLWNWFCKDSHLRAEDRMVCFFLILVMYVKGGVLLSWYCYPIAAFVFVAKSKPLWTIIFWFKHIILVNTKRLGVAKLRRKPPPMLFSHKTLPYTICTKCWCYPTPNPDSNWSV